MSLLKHSGNPISKVILVGGVLIGGTLSLALLINMLKKDRIAAEGEKLAQAISRLPMNAGNVTLSANDLTLMAQQLMAAMDKMGTDGESIFRVMQRATTKDDLVALIKAFGVHRYYLWGRSEKRGAYLNLTEWLKRELSSSAFNKNVAAIYQKFGMQY
jgi:outer membrane murein-binding lipoprotein Lpp